MAALRKAERRMALLRIGVAGPSGSGKTRSALELAYGITGDWEKIAVIDTENGSADLYSHLGGYNVLTLSAPFTPESYIKAIKECEAAGMEVIIIDSITHEWNGKGGCLEIVEDIASKMKNPNSYTSWSKVTPRHQAFIDAIVGSSCHIITTVRSKQDYMMTEGSDGKKKIEKVGMAQVTRDGFEYELTMSFELTIDHKAFSSKDRTGLFMDQPGFIITAETGEKIIEWNKTGVDVEAKKKDLFEGYEKALTNSKDLEELKLCYELIQGDKESLGRDFLDKLILIKDEIKNNLINKESKSKKEEKKDVAPNK